MKTLSLLSILSILISAVVASSWEGSKYIEKKPPEYVTYVTVEKTIADPQQNFRQSPPASQVKNRPRFAKIKDKWFRAKNLLKNLTGLKK